MEGPTSVSALIHSATMVTAGVFLIARLFPLFQISELMPLIAIVGALTAFISATMALTTTDIKSSCLFCNFSTRIYVYGIRSWCIYCSNFSSIHTCFFSKAGLF